MTNTRTYRISEETKQPETSPLIEAVGVQNGLAIEWGDWQETKQVEGLTPVEIRALRDKYAAQKKPQEPNYKRALEVKRLLEKGFIQADVVKVLRPKGYGYSQTAVKIDCTTLLRSWGRGNKKARKN